ncbi:unnamed protein product, partial [Ectocarpus fasciculatus]
GASALRTTTGPSATRSSAYPGSGPTGSPRARRPSSGSWRRRTTSTGLCWTGTTRGRTSTTVRSRRRSACGSNTSGWRSGRNRGAGVAPTAAGRSRSSAAVTSWRRRSWRERSEWMRRALLLGSGTALPGRSGRVQGNAVHRTRAGGGGSLEALHCRWNRAPVRPLPPGRCRAPLPLRALPIVRLLPGVSG